MNQLFALRKEKQGLVNINRIFAGIMGRGQNYLSPPSNACCGGLAYNVSHL
jgi:hypothetical protein